MVIKPWISAFRLRTLPLSLSSIGMGAFLAAAQGKFNGLIFGLCCLTTILLQILSNLANDFGDTVNGADNARRKGPSRAVQSGAIQVGAMKTAIAVFVVLSLCSGIATLLVAFGMDASLLITFLGLGLLSIVAAVMYTVGRKPYGYAGLGDISVLIFFGLVGVIGSLFLFTKNISSWSFLPALACGFFSIGVLNINNMRDIESDRIAGKLSIPVRIGKKKAGYYHWFLLLGGLLAATIYNLLNFQSPFQFLFLLSLPLFLSIGKAVNERPSEELDPYLKRMALSTLLFVVLFGAGQLISL